MPVLTSVDDTGDSGDDTGDEDNILCFGRIHFSVSRSGEMNGISDDGSAPYELERARVLL